MFQLMAAQQLFPPSFFRLLDTDIEKQLEPFGDGNRFPSLILNPHRAYMSDDYGTYRFESEAVPVFAAFLALELFDYRLSELEYTLLEKKEPLPLLLLDKIRGRYGHDVLPEERAWFDEVLLGMTWPSFAQLHLELTEFFDHKGATADIQSDIFQSWTDFCLLYHERLLALRLAFLDCRCEKEEHDETEYGNVPFSPFLSDFEEDGFHIVPRDRTKTVDEWDLLVHPESPVRGGGFSCMR